MTSTEEEKNYTASIRKSVDPGKSAKLEFDVSLKYPADISHLIGKSAGELEQMIASSKEKEKIAFNKLSPDATEWEQQAIQTALLNRALEYAKVRVPKHTSNQWIKHDNDRYEISNMVYKMTYNIHERTEYDEVQKKQVPVAWNVTWSVMFNVPSNYYNSHSGRSATIASQSDKRYTDKAAAEKYLQGRIAAYAHLFTELSPPLPEDRRATYSVNGFLLPGYTVQAHEPTPDELLAFIEDADIPADKAPESPTPTAPVEKNAPAQRSMAKKQAHNRHVKRK